MKVRRYLACAAVATCFCVALPAWFPSQTAQSILVQPPNSRGEANPSVASKEISKFGIETSTKPLVAMAGRASHNESNFVNPKVSPGKVRWHASYEAARLAAEKSGHPVLLFQMMGKLDDQFC